MLGNFRKMFRNLREVAKISLILLNKQNITCPVMDADFDFLCSNHIELPCIRPAPLKFELTNQS